MMHTQIFDQLIKSNNEFKIHFYKHYPTHHSSTEEELSITEFCHFFIPIILEYIDKVSPDELDEKTWEEVLKHFEAC